MDFCHLSLKGKALGCGIQHVFYKDTVAAGGVIDQDMGHCAYQFAVLDVGTTGHFCVKCGTKEFCVFWRFLCVLQVKGRF